MIRFFDLLFSILGMVFLSPLFAFVALWIKLDLKRPVFYKQTRVGGIEQQRFQAA